jgi:putative nucleotidyltransferase with HDIG domain
MAKGNPTPRKGRSVFSSQRTEKGLAWLRDLQENALAQFVLFVSFIVAIVAVMTAGFNVQDVNISSAQIGKPSLRPVVAMRDFTFVEQDEEATERLRERVTLAVPPVYDWQEGLGEKLRDDTHKSFESMREGIAAKLRERAIINQPSPAPNNTPAPNKNEISESSDTEILAKAQTSQIIDIARELRAERFDHHMPATLSEQDFETFARDRFSYQTENILTTIVSEAMGQLLVPSSRVFEDELDRGIYLRRIRDDKILIEYHLTDLRGRLNARENIPGFVREQLQQRPNDLGQGNLRAAVFRTSTSIIQPNTTYNEAMTLDKRDAARAAVADVVVRENFRKGQIIVAKGERITARHIRIVDTMNDADAFSNTAQIITGLILFSLLLMVTFYLFGRHNINGFELKNKDIAFLGATMLLFLLFTRVGKAISYSIGEQLTQIPADAWLFAIPVAGAGMLVRLILRSEHAIVFSIVYAVLAGIIMDEMLFYSIFTLVGCLVGANFVRQVKTRLTLMWSGLVVGLINVATLTGFLLLQGELFTAQAPIMLLLGFCGGIASGFVVSSILPVFEAGFAYTTDIKLLELANLNHPLLRELILRSPGSYHHSMMVGSLCEAAAEEIGCNSLLARVGAYYHDIGKSKNPGYFAENQKFGENPHDKLKPNMSALIIKAHVKDGIEMARQQRLPKEIIAFIEQHHGTSLISYFYHRAKQLEDPNIPEVNEKDYRYPGPKPQMRETAICLLADGIEAASRSMKVKSPDKLKGLVQTMINRAFTDGQLDECDLTLKDLNAIADAFTRILTGIYHHRPEYPGGKKKETTTKETPAVQEPNRPQRNTGEVAGKESGERPAVKPNRQTKQTPAVKNEKEEKKADGDRDPDPGKGDEPPEASEDPRDPPEEGRASLPRLGSS